MVKVETIYSRNVACFVDIVKTKKWMESIQYFFGSYYYFGR